MSQVTYLRDFRRATDIYTIDKRDDDSWWVYRQSFRKGTCPLPLGRVVYFARSLDVAQTWAEQQETVGEIRVREICILPPTHSLYPQTNTLMIKQG